MNFTIAQYALIGLGIWLFYKGHHVAGAVVVGFVFLPQIRSAVGV